jgi:hypothetical protein
MSRSPKQSLLFRLPNCIFVSISHPPHACVNSVTRSLHYNPYSTLRVLRQNMLTGAGFFFRDWETEGMVSTESARDASAAFRGSERLSHAIRNNPHRKCFIDYKKLSCLCRLVCPQLRNVKLSRELIHLHFWLSPVHSFTQHSTRFSSLHSCRHSSSEHEVACWTRNGQILQFCNTFHLLDMKCDDQNITCGSSFNLIHCNKIIAIAVFSSVSRNRKNEYSYVELMFVIARAVWVWPTLIFSVVFCVDL